MIGDGWKRPPCRVTAPITLIGLADLRVSWRDSLMI
jgi:hypothetical protein